MKICLFLSATFLDDELTNETLSLVRALVNDGHTIIHGGSRRGLMGQVTDEVLQLNGNIIGVVSETFKKEWRNDLTQRIECKDISSRKRKIFDMSDVVIALPGGTGTLDEVTETIEIKKWEGSKKPIILYNIDNFWNGFITQLKTMQQKELLHHKPLNELIQVASTTEDVLELIQS